MKFAFFDKFFNQELDFRVRLFNVLALGGMFVCAFMCVKDLLLAGSELDALFNGIGAFLAFGLLYFSCRTGRYRLCYVISIAIFFLGLFPALFFMNEGYHGGMPIFFVFALLFTVYMLEGRTLLVVASFEIVVYVSLFLVAWLRPELVVPFDSEWLRMQDVAFAFVCTSGVLGAAMFLHFRLYKDQQRRLEEASNAKTAFLASMSHEIRTPLNVIMGLNELIRVKAYSRQVINWSGEIQDAGRTLIKLIDELLDISKIEAGKHSFILAEYRMAELIHALATVGERETRNRGLEFTVRSDPGLPSKLKGDSFRVRQIITNFLVNAAKYTERGTVTLTAEAEKTDVSGNVILRLSVSDTGIGISPEDMVFLFEKFSRVSASHGKSGRHVEGVGLGLAISKELSEKMGGEIKVESAPGEGSTFTLLLPQESIDATPMGDWRDESPSAASDQASGETLFTAPEGRVLAVDDNAANLRLVREFLRRLKLRTDTASGGRECIETVRKALEDQTPYHVILMDYMMPDMDGIETLRQLREQFPDFDTPVVALTADAIVGEREKFLASGFAGYLSKPVARLDLERAVFALLPEALRHAVETPPAGPQNEEQNPSVPTPQNGWESALLEYGISLSEGLKYASGDMELYRTQAVIFLESAGPSRSAIESKRDEEDWAGMVPLVHSLKGEAGYAGAVVLRDAALKVERACRAGAADCARLALPLLFMEWERACEGLENFMRNADGQEEVKPDA